MEYVAVERVLLVARQNIISFRKPIVQASLVECCSNHITTRISIQTAGLAFGGTGLCSYRVKGVCDVFKAFTSPLLASRTSR